MPEKFLRTKVRRKESSPNFLSPQHVSEIKLLLNQTSRDSSIWIEGDLASDATDYLRDHFWSKCSSKGVCEYTGKADVSPQDRRSLAIKKWLVAEKRNEKTNSRLRDQLCDFGFATSSSIVRLAKKFTQETLGKFPSVEIFDLGEFTGGASTRVKRGPSAIAQKFESRAHCSASAKPYFALVIDRCPGWLCNVPQIVETEEQNASVMFTVPKNSAIDRVACKEPEINMYLQRSVGLFIRKRLKNKGIDLTDQSRNQRLAKSGSVTRKLATIDLSSASDTISTSIVEALLPPAWFSLLNDLRVKEVIIPGVSEVHPLQMFSSMGNGFTFELETLVFWALCRATQYLIGARGPISVYGDDIICPRKTAMALHRVLPWFGFILNVDKTFVRGPYRESCGKHYVNGFDVTPVYLRSIPSCRTEVIQLHNQLLAWFIRVESLNSNLWALILALRKYIPKKYYGGQDLERTDALVTGDTPRYRLHQLDEECKVPMSGALVQWLHMKDKSPLLVCSPTEVSREGRWVSRPNRSWYMRELMIDCSIVNYRISLL